ncbi:calcium/sodium antiporter [Flexithrix dorotheae]|uniref:calcium/sodium antiporter n=1 Tax=Flexithrix dorotheae TaxID=70993 RepID=UPI00037C3338|nr:calcium/sodium antiporter [Flexithrix dorotheae]
MLYPIILLLVGFVLLIVGANWLVDGATSLAKKYGISDLTIGLTIVAFGTSAPELIVNIMAASEGHQSIVLGNIVGSNNFNLFFILGLTGLITPIVVQSTTVWKEIPFSILAALLLYLLSNELIFSEEPLLSRIDGIILLIFFGLFMMYVYQQLNADQSTQITKKVNTPKWKVIALILIGFIGLVAGGRLVMNNAILLATELGVNEKIIALTIVAAGTSLPELATSIIAAIKKNNDIAVGNVIGSNIFNIFFILGGSTVINSIYYDKTFNTDIYLLLGGTLFLFVAMFTGQRKKLDRWEAGILFIVYILYTIYLINAEL